MPVWLARLGAYALSNPDDFFKTLLILILGIVFAVVILLGGPIFLLMHFPAGETSDFEMYKNAALEYEKEVGLLVNWQQVMAIDAVLFEQDFSKSSPLHVRQMTERFVWEEIIEIKVTYQKAVYDEDGNFSHYEDKTRTEYRTVYNLYSFDEMINILISEGQLTSEQFEDVKRYNTFDLAEFLEGGGAPELPDNWRPTETKYAWPTPGIYRVTSLFGPRIDPINNSESYHNGLDIGAPTGTDIVPIANGKVTFAGELGNAGNAVVIGHEDGTESRYYHLSKISVKKNQTVELGDVIGKVGNTGRSTGAHLHLEIRISGSPVDPLTYYISSE